MKAGRVGEVTFEGVGHLIPMEVVDRTAEACAGWIAPEVERWRVGEEVEGREWGGVGRERRGMMTEGFLEAMKGEKAKL